MRHLFDALHLLFAVFAIGPLVHAATTASRGVRNGDSAAIDSSARVLRIYGFASILVPIFGLALVQKKYGHEFGDTWIWLSLVLYVAAVVAVFAVLLPGLKQASAAINGGGSAPSLTARIAASGGIVALIFAAIIVLMVYKPGR